MKPLHLVFTPTRNRRLNELIGLVLLVLSGLLLLSLVSYHPTDPSLNTVAGNGQVQNWIGPAGANVSDALLQLEGLAALLFPILIAGLGWTWLRSRRAGSPAAKVIGAVLAALFAPALFGLLPGHLHWMHAVPIEGLTGRLACDTLIRYLNLPGTAIVVLSMVAVSLYLSTTFSFDAAREWLAVRTAFFLAWRDRLKNWRTARAQANSEKALAKQEARREKELAKQQKAAEKAKKRSQPAVADEDETEIPAFRRSGFAEVSGHAAAPAIHPAAATPTLWNEMPRTFVPDLQPEPEPEPRMEPELPVAYAAALPKPEPVRTPPPARPEPRRIMVGERAETDARQVTVAPKSVSGFKLPPSTLLHRSEDAQTVREDELLEEATVLVEKCAEFDVRGQVVQINPGPVVTTFEFRPEAGVKYSRVTGLAEDLCLAMRAESILIERMAGKSTVGIQVPNRQRETIWLRDVIEAEDFAKTRSRLVLAIGKDINGRIVTADLATMPHVLIAGSTGSGKSVTINAMIMSVLYKATPEQVRLILVDPKRVELGMYEGIPHLFTPIITEPKLAANALRNAVREMERRLKLLASRSVRNIDQYNKLFENGTPSLFEDPQADRPLPSIVIIIDELADLMMLDKANVEEAITRLAQMARAVGIHLVLATQRPSVDVITGLIKANVPTRISFRLATKVDSRTILDSNGAESLLGRGDMLFLPPGTSRLHRLHAPFVTEKEIAAVVDFWKKQGEAEYVQGFLESPKDDRGNDLDIDPGDDSNDEIFEDAVRLVLEFGKASTSLLQRRLRIGYGRAAHLIDMMERDGIV
ncbi:MAG TPA: DNA translocase FtsK 4TM domain-containing protein, partial [Acidobacteriaceae bacterium]|nr:DNA translocase FtsK 4TM domain-containing protein [Acidobacteriaceae bacterium]